MGEGNGVGLDRAVIAAESVDRAGFLDGDERAGAFVAAEIDVGKPAAGERLQHLIATVQYVAARQRRQGRKLDGAGRRPVRFDKRDRHVGVGRERIDRGTRDLTLRSVAIAAVPALVAVAARVPQAWLAAPLLGAVVSLDLGSVNAGFLSRATGALRVPAGEILFVA